MTGGPVRTAADPLMVARQLLQAGRAKDALAITAPLVASRDARHTAVALHAQALITLKRHDEAYVFAKRAAETWPTSPVAWHNLAGALVDLGRAEEALAAIQTGMDIGLDAALSWLIRARALRYLRRTDEACVAYGRSLSRDPTLTDAATELAQCVWMTSGALIQAVAPLDACFRAGGDMAVLLHAKARLLELAGKGEEGRSLVIEAAKDRPADVGLALVAVQAAVAGGRTDLALEMATRAQARVPGDPQTNIHLALALLAASRPQEALVAARKAAAIAPEAQDAWGWVATAARAAGDPIYGRLCDYDRLVCKFEVAPPAPWTSQDVWLDDLADALDAIHDGQSPPYDQSLRNGTQTFGELSESPNQVIQSFFRAIDAPIRKYMASIGAGSDPLRRRNTGLYQMAGSWSVRLNDQGWHTDHFHPEGWISSAFYVRLPKRAMGGSEKDGWIQFGHAPFPLLPSMPAEHAVEPTRGAVVLFPSYMWHGTIPFSGDETRLTIAFDVTPA